MFTLTLSPVGGGGDRTTYHVANGIPEPGSIFPHPALRATVSRGREKESRCGLRPGSWVGNDENAEQIISFMDCEALY